MFFSKTSSNSNEVVKIYLRILMPYLNGMCSSFDFKIHIIKSSQIWCILRWYCTDCTYNMYAC